MDHRTMVLNDDSEFKFHCHHGLECFNKCCRDINIYLSPYDVLRMKNFLGLSSNEFLEKYTLKMHVPQTASSLVQIKMSELDGLNCPFLTPGGCQVYPERPWACRIAPVDMLGGGKYSFIFESSRCHGLNEDKAQTVQEWVRDQGLEIYEGMEQGFSEIPKHLKLTGNQEADAKIIKLFFMACYNLDEFRTFLGSNPALYKALKIPEEVQTQISQDDVSLMKFGFTLLLSPTDTSIACQSIT